MSYKVDNAVIMAAGTASRFAPLSYERPKALIEVNGEVLIERQICQLQAAGIRQIIVVVGYMKEQFDYLAEKFGVILVENKDYLTRNNNASIWVAREYIRNTYICSSDNYFTVNPFEPMVEDAYYAAVYAEGETAEWCIREGADGYIDNVCVGGSDAWIMLGHTFWSEPFSKAFLEILEAEYDAPQTCNALWETIYMQHLDVLKMKIRRYHREDIFEFDTLDELRMFDGSYISDTRSEILKEVARRMACTQADICRVTAFKRQDNSAAGMHFCVQGKRYEYTYAEQEIRELS